MLKTGLTNVNICMFFLINILLTFQIREEGEGRGIEGIIVYVNRENDDML